MRGLGFNDPFHFIELIRKETRSELDFLYLIVKATYKEQDDNDAVGFGDECGQVSHRSQSARCPTRQTHFLFGNKGPLAGRDPSGAQVGRRRASSAESIVSSTTTTTNDVFQGVGMEGLHALSRRSRWLGLRTLPAL
jgi:hypothetical protein